LNARASHARPWRVPARPCAETVPHRDVLRLRSRVRVPLRADPAQRGRGPVRPPAGNGYAAKPDGLPGRHRAALRADLRAAVQPAPGGLEGARSLASGTGGRAGGRMRSTGSASASPAPATQVRPEPRRQRWLTRSTSSSHRRDHPSHSRASAPPSRPPGAGCTARARSARRAARWSSRQAVGLCCVAVSSRRPYRSPTTLRRSARRGTRTRLRKRSTSRCGTVSAQGRAAPAGSSVGCAGVQGPIPGCATSGRMTA